MRATIGLFTILLAFNTSAAELLTRWLDCSEPDRDLVSYSISHDCSNPHVTAEAYSFFLPMAEVSWLEFTDGTVDTSLWDEQPDQRDVDGDGVAEDGWRLYCPETRGAIKYGQSLVFQAMTASDHWTLQPVLQKFRWEGLLVESIVWVELPAAAALAGDADLNGVVDFRDAWTVLGNFRNASGCTWADGDFDGDGTVDLDDVEALCENYQGDMPAAIAGAIAAAVPEPGTLVLLSAGVAGLLRRRR